MFGNKQPHRVTSHWTGSRTNDFCLRYCLFGQPPNRHLALHRFSSSYRSCTHTNTHTQAHTYTCTTPTLRKILNLMGRFLDQCTQLTLHKVSHSCYIPQCVTITIETMCPEVSKQSRLIMSSFPLIMFFVFHKHTHILKTVFDDFWFRNSNPQKTRKE